MISMEIKFSLQIEVITIFGKKKFRSITYKNIIQSDHKKKRPSLYLSYLKSDFNERYIKLKGSKSTINWI
jgi:hypothetical protein